MVLGCLALHFCASLCKTAHLPCQFLWQVSAEQEVRTEQWVGGFQPAVHAPCSKPSHDSTLPGQYTCGAVSPCLAGSRRRQRVVAPRHDTQPTQTHSQSVCKIREQLCPRLIQPHLSPCTCSPVYQVHAQHSDHQACPSTLQLSKQRLQPPPPP